MGFAARAGSNPVSDTTYLRNAAWDTTRTDKVLEACAEYQVEGVSEVDWMTRRPAD